MRKIVYTCFKVYQSYYLYDRNRNKIIKISEDDYHLLNKITSDEEIEKFKSKLQPYIASGFLQKDRLKEIKHSSIDQIDLYINNKVGQLLLQVTQNCNLRCKYCYFGEGNYMNRTHNEKVMTFDIAKKGIDYLFSHSLDQDNLTITFYGGEPLLNFALIKQCVEYIECETEGKQVIYSMTTNATLLNEEIIDFCAKHNFMLLISFDGDEEAHNQNRVFVNGKGTHDTVLKNVKKILEKYPEYAKTIDFNTVITPTTHFDSILKYMYHIEGYEDNNVKFSPVNNNSTNEASQGELSEEYYIIRKYAYFKKMLEWVNKLEEGSSSKLNDTAIGEINLNRKILEAFNGMPEYTHPSGPCIAGSTKIFVTADGTLYPCEKVSELSKNMQIGTLDNGINLDKVKKLINVGKTTEDSCSQCPAFYFCNLCAFYSDDCNELRPDLRLNHCDKVKSKAIHMFRTICLLEDFNYDFEKGDFYE